MVGTQKARQNRLVICKPMTSERTHRCACAHISPGHACYRGTTRAKFLITGPALEKIALLVHDKKGSPLYCGIQSLLQWWNPQTAHLFLFMPVDFSRQGIISAGIEMGINFSKRKDRHWQLRWLFSWKPTHFGSRHPCHPLILFFFITPISCPSGLHVIGLILYLYIYVSFLHMWFNVSAWSAVMGTSDVLCWEM